MSDAKTPPMFKSKTGIYVLSGTAVILAVILFYFAFFYLLYPRALPQRAIDSLPDARLPGAGQKMLVFTPHPDDETIGVGGYIAESVKNGAAVRVVLVTDGNKHHNEMVRYAEFEKATGMLGVSPGNLVFLGMPDGKIESLSRTMLYDSLKKQIDDYNPDFIIYPTPRDFHPDHATVGKIVSQIISDGYGDRTSYQYLVHYEVYYPHPKKYAPGLYLMPPLRLLKFGDGWGKVMLPDDIEELKREAIFSYQSQIKDPALTDLLLSNIRKNELLITP